MKREVDFLKRPDVEYDCVVIGGGIQGAGIAREASLQGLKTLLVERSDFASGTTSRSTKLIHGGLRYFEQGRLGLITESLKERKILMQMMPHLVRPLPFIFPIYKHGRFPAWQISLGLSLYDRLAKEGKIKAHEAVSSKKLSENFPSLEIKELKKAFLYWDAATNDSRLCLEVVKAAHRLGSQVMNYMRVIGFTKTEGKISGVSLKDLRSGEVYEVKTKIVINAAGIWADDIRQLAESSLQTRIRRSKGIHLVCRRLFTSSSQTQEPAAFIFPTRDKRVFFVIPWLENTTLIGTTDTDFKGKPSECYAVKDEVEYLLKEFRRFFPKMRIQRSDIYATLSGIRALVDRQGVSSAVLSRESEIEDLDMGLLSVLGGKYTTFRSIAAKVVAKALKRLDMTPRYEDTSYLSLDGLSLDAAGLQKKRAELEKRATYYGVSKETFEHLWNNYGLNTSEIFKLLDYDPSLSEGLVAGRFPLKAEVVYAIKDEMSLTLTDFLRRRSQLFYAQAAGLDVLDEVARIYQDFLHWSDEEIERQKQAYREEVQKNVQPLDSVDYAAI